MKIKVTYFTLIFCLLLTSCGYIVREPLSYKDPLLRSLPNYEAYRLLATAQTLPYPERGSYEIKAVAALLENRLYQEASRLLPLIPETSLTPTLLTQKQLQQARFFVLTQKGREASQILNRIKSDRVNTEDQVLYHELYAASYELVRNYLESARTRVWLDELLSSVDQIKDNRDKLWQALLKVQPRILKAQQVAPPPDIFSGWLALAEIGLTYASRTTDLVEAVKAWQEQYPLHPANDAMPDPIGLYLSVPVVYPPKIALLLPLQGQLTESATALQHGFFTAHRELQTNAAMPLSSIQLYDSTEGNIQTVYNRAIHDGVNLVVGPLTKPEIEQLITDGSLPVATLALNYLPADKKRLGEATPNFYQFGLAPEDEVAQMADRLYQQGHRRPILIVPNDQLGKRVITTFLKTSAKYHQGPIALFEFNLNEDISTQIHEKFKQYEQRQAPYDSVALVAQPPEARQIKPLISYYFSEDLPVYATSHVFSGVTSAAADQDLDGIYFIDSPWLLNAPGTPSPEMIGSEDERFKRFFALGYDAFKIIPYLRQFNSNKFKWFGLTGALKVEGNTLHRQLSWGQFRGGVPLLVE